MYFSWALKDLMDVALPAEAFWLPSRWAINAVRYNEPGLLIETRLADMEGSSSFAEMKVGRCPPFLRPTAQSFSSYHQ